MICVIVVMGMMGKRRGVGGSCGDGWRWVNAEAGRMSETVICVIVVMGMMGQWPRCDCAGLLRGRIESS